MQNEQIVNLSWDEYFMGIAIFTSFRSKDPNSKVGCVLVDDQNHIIGTGYNGFVTGVDETQLSWERDGEYLETKYPYVIHAEANALLNSTNSDLKGCRLYSTLYPCSECVKLIAQKGITDVYYLQHKYPEIDTFKAAEKLLSITGINIQQCKIDNLHDLITKFKDYYPEQIFQ